jgi:hypothetical protein
VARLATTARRLFADTRRVIETDGDAVHRWHAARKHGAPVLTGDRPWDRAGAFVYGTVLREDGRFRIWYQARDSMRGGNGHTVAYAESPDGLTWDKPDLGVVAFRDSCANNLTNLVLHNASVGRHESAGYWAAGHASGGSAPDGAAGVYLWRSAEGLRWEREGGEPLWRTGAGSEAVGAYGFGSDVNSIVHDPFRDRYLAASKLHLPLNGSHRRAFAIRTSPDLRQWSAPRMALAPDAEDDARARDLGAHHADFYGLTFHVYPEFVIGFVWVFYMVAPVAANRWPASRSRYFGWSRHGHIAEVQTVFSYDGEYWIRPARRPAFIAAGERTWDGGNLATANYPVTAGDEHFHYYGAGPVYHGAVGEPEVPFRGETGVFTAIGLARTGRDRYASYSANVGGSVLVHHGRLDGGSLRVNARAPYGGVFAQVLDGSGREVPGLGLADCVPFTGDAVDGEVRWRQADLRAVPTGEEAAIRFVLNEADLYGYEVVA